MLLVSSESDNPPWDIKEVPTTPIYYCNSKLLYVYRDRKVGVTSKFGPLVTLFTYTGLLDLFRAGKGWLADGVVSLDMAWTVAAPFGRLDVDVNNSIELISSISTHIIAPMKRHNDSCMYRFFAPRALCVPPFRNERTFYQISPARHSQSNHPSESDNPHRGMIPNQGSNCDPNL